MESIGILHDRIMREFQWEIGIFSSIPLYTRKNYVSSSFLYDGDRWHFEISFNNSAGYIGIYLCKEFGSPKELTYSLSFKTSEGKKFKEETITHVFKENQGSGFSKFCPTFTLLEKKSELLPSDTLTIICCMRSCKKATNNADNERVAKCPFCKEDFKVDYISTHEEKCFAKPIECPKCQEKIDVRKCFSHECHLEKIKGTEKLEGDLMTIFRNGDHSDITVNVKDEKFRLHKCILAGRNPFFNSMFKTEMKEKITGIVSINDCKPDVFRSFIHFVYTGKVDEMSEENVCDLYEVADKYQEDQLKEECLCFMKRKLSVDTFCDFIVMALKHSEKDLLQNATDLFCRNVTEIIRCVKWQTFMGEYPTQANELNIKAFDYVMSRLKISEDK